MPTARTGWPEDRTCNERLDEMAKKPFFGVICRGERGDERIEDAFRDPCFSLEQRSLYACILDKHFDGVTEVAVREFTHASRLNNLAGSSRRLASDGPSPPRSAGGKMTE